MIQTTLLRCIGGAAILLFIWTMIRLIGLTIDELHNILWLMGVCSLV